METPDGTEPVAFAPSAVPNSRFHVMPVPLTEALIAEIVDGYGQAARRLAEAGYDGCEIVASHGYLPAQFLNPQVNRRTDTWGGTPENRLRFLRTVIAEIRASTGRGFVVGLRISGDEIDGTALPPEEMALFCRMLDADGSLDYISVVAGTSASLRGAAHIVPPMDHAPGYTAPLAARIKASVRMPVIATGRINDPGVAERILAAGQADCVGMTRAMIADPEMPNKVIAGMPEDVRACIGCNQACIGHFHRGYPISCIQYPESGRELAYGKVEPAKTPRRILVAGGGPAGMKAALTLARRGHEVSLHEATMRLGGQVLLAQLLPGRAEFGGLATNLEQELRRSTVRVHLGSRVDADLVRRETPDCVVVAIGALPHMPAIEIGDGACIATAWDILQGRVRAGARVVIADWRSDWIGAGLAEMLARAGSRVSLCVEAVMVGEKLPFYVRDGLVGRLHKLGVEMQTYLRLYGVDGTTVWFEHMASGEAVVFEDVDTIVLSQGHAPLTGLSDALAGWPGEVHAIGDALCARTAEEAVLDGLKLGVRLG
jgi:2,4-dienoyl-CoA reductase-like NADH-dependent reductase (Old Yellow Enzyme family)